MKLLPESNDITGLSNHFELSCWLRIVLGEITLNPQVINPRSRFTWLIRTDSSLLYTQPTKHWRLLGCLMSQAVFIPFHSIQLSYGLCVSIQGDKCCSGQRMSSSRLLQWMDSSELIMILHRLLRASFEAGRHGALRDQPINILVHWQAKNRSLHRPTCGMNIWLPCTLSTGCTPSYRQCNITFHWTSRSREFSPVSYAFKSCPVNQFCGFAVFLTTCRENTEIAKINLDLEPSANFTIRCLWFYHLTPQNLDGCNSETIF